MLIIYIIIIIIIACFVPLYVTVCVCNTNM